MDWFLYDNGLHHERVKGEMYDTRRCLTIFGGWRLKG